MRENISERAVALNEILMELYAKRENIEIDEIETKVSPYKDFAKDITKKLKEILKALKCDIEQFKNDNNRYDIPVVVAEILKIYLSEDSGKGSYISKIKRKKFFEIEFEEKINFIKKVAEQLREKYAEDSNKEKVFKEIDDLEKIWIGEAKYSEVVKDEVIETESIVNMIMEACMFKVASISELDGLVTVDNGNSADYSEEEILEIINSEDRVELPYSAKLSYQDRLELLKYFKVFLINNIKEWKKIVDIASELRQYNVEDDAINKSGLISSDELLKSAINEYEEEIKDTMKPIDIPKHTPEEFCKILNELGYKKKNKK
ncbi:hypothetical protein [Clostridium saudiense]|uniref:hypothetical protein n=1 Tax=Clostridium saudiense TaxID=1414720 RepID=UPI0018AA313F|nr:hypothetical protein [Clostridium saudiense]